MLVAVTAMGPVAMHLFVPSMPGLVDSFQTTPGHVQLTLTLYMLALAVATLIAGPLSDRFGRRPVILGALVIYTLAAVACALASSIEWLIAARIAQAVGGAAGLTLGRTMVRDCLDAGPAASLIATLSMLVSVVPALSPALGGYLDVWLGWRASFVVLAAFGALTCLAGLRWLTETNPHAGPGHAPVGQLQIFGELVRNRVFMGYGLHCVCTLSAWYGIVAGAPFVMVTVMGRGPGEYGTWFVLVAVGWITGNLLTSQLATRTGVKRLVLAGVLVTLAASVMLVGVVAADALTPARLFVPLALMGVGHGLSQPSAMSGAIGVHPHAAGRASGLLGFVQMASGAAAAQLLGIIQAGSAWPMAIMVCVISLISLGCWVVAVTPGRVRDA
jgi:DHA1 family bicyclomycin/chloramphenicol resistance-like MFS transporter